MTQVDVDPPSKEQLLKTTGIAAAIAVVVLLVAVLPAEYGIDPLRTGQLLGLTDDGIGQVDAHHVALEPVAEYETEVTLAPGAGWTEAGLKVYLLAGESLQYGWSATGNITYDFHNDQGGSYRDGQGVGQGAEGFLTAPVEGYHGFAIRNNTDSTITFSLRFVGEFDPSTDLYAG